MASWLTRYRSASRWVSSSSLISKPPVPTSRANIRDRHQQLGRQRIRRHLIRIDRFRRRVVTMPHGEIAVDEQISPRVEQQVRDLVRDGKPLPVLRVERVHANNGLIGIPV